MTFFSNVVGISSLTALETEWASPPRLRVFPFSANLHTRALRLWHGPCFRVECVRLGCFHTAWFPQ